MPTNQTSISHQIGHQQRLNGHSPIPTTPCIGSVELIIPDRPWIQNGVFSGATASQQPKETLLIENNLAERLRNFLPTRCKLLSSWVLTYSTAAYGFSLSTLYSRCKTAGPAILAIKDETGQIFGAFCSESIAPQLNHFGTGECFLWKISENNIKIYNATGKSPFYTVAEPDFLAFGCGEGKFGLLLDGDLFSGQSNIVSTFDNEILSATQKFDIISVEIWTFK